MVVIIGASSLCRTLDSIPYKTKKLFVRSCFSVPGLSFNDKAINRHKILQNLLTRGSLRKVNNIIIWHDVINNSISPHRSNNYQPNSIDQLIENLLLFKDRIKAIVYCRRLGMQVISPNAISPKNLVESFRLKKLGEMTKRE